MQFFPNSMRMLVEKGQQALCPRVKHPPSIMVWGGMSERGLTSLAVIVGTVDSRAYQDILNGYLIRTADALYPEGWFLQQDNAPSHKSKATMKFFQDQGLQVLDWPANSPDLNPIETLWAIIKRRLAECKKTTVMDWKQKVEIEKIEIWDEISDKQLQRLVESMPRRIEACIAAAGCHTKY